MVGVLLADPYSFPVDAFVERSDEALPGLPLVGGLAESSGPGEEGVPGEAARGEARLFVGGEVYGDGAVGVVIGGPVAAATVVSQGARPIGPDMVVTKAEENVLYELAGVPALEKLEQIVLELPEDEQELAGRGLLIGVAMDEYADEHEHGDFLVRGVVGADTDSGAIAIGDVVDVGRTVRFQVRDAGAAEEDLAALLERFDLTPVEGALLFSCNGRGQAMFPDSDHDAKVLDRAFGPAGVGGFFAADEIGPVSGRNHVHGFTASILAFGRGRALERPRHRPRPCHRHRRDEARRRDRRTGRQRRRPRPRPHPEHAGRGRRGAVGRAGRAARQTARRRRRPAARGRRRRLRRAHDVARRRGVPAEHPGVARLPAAGAAPRPPSGLPVRIHNDAICVAVGEHWLGAGRGHDNVLGMVVSTGVGGGLILGGHLVNGASGNAGHIGHVIVEPDGPPCACGGRGCLEAIARGPGLVAWAQQQGWRPGGSDVTGVELAADARRGDPVAGSAMRRAGRAIGLAIASATHLCDLEVAAIGGGLSQATLLFDPMNEAFRTHARMDFARRARIVPAALGQTAGLVGAAALVYAQDRYWSAG